MTPEERKEFERDFKEGFNNTFKKLDGQSYYRKLILTAEIEALEKNIPVNISTIQNVLLSALYKMQDLLKEGAEQ